MLLCLPHCVFQVAQVLSFHTSTYWDGEIPEQSHTQNTKTQSFVIMFGLSAQLAQQHTFTNHLLIFFYTFNVMRSSYNIEYLTVILEWAPLPERCDI